MTDFITMKMEPDVIQYLGQKVVQYELGERYRRLEEILIRQVGPMYDFNASCFYSLNFLPESLS